MILWTKEYEVLYALVLLRAVRLKQDGKNFEKKICHSQPLTDPPCDIFRPYFAFKTLYF